MGKPHPAAPRSSAGELNPSKAEYREPRWPAAAAELPRESDAGPDLIDRRINVGDSFYPVTALVGFC